MRLTSTLTLTLTLLVACTTPALANPVVAASSSSDLTARDTSLAQARAEGASWLARMFSPSTFPAARAGEEGKRRRRRVAGPLSLKF